ncbi:hypothetical protein GCM10023189_15090 [Nibrella saemangeumensis]|uniref:Thioredoxin domain-containing protein n=1 Tax=Nibrella saemangeumensis TaxID=1084526 RepID=A0ABP8MN67_9BACT
MPVYRPLFIPPKTAVLLVFMPRVSSLSLDVELLLERVGAVLGDAVKITRVDESTHPEVVNSFGVRMLPSFVLIMQGNEIWRHTGSIEGSELLQLLAEQLEKLQPRLDTLPVPNPIEPNRLSL